MTVNSLPFAPDHIGLDEDGEFYAEWIWKDSRVFLGTDKELAFIFSVGKKGHIMSEIWEFDV